VHEEWARIDVAHEAVPGETMKWLTVVALCQSEMGWL
jgi:hypothetical protein